MLGLKLNHVRKSGPLCLALIDKVVIPNFFGEKSENCYSLKYTIMREQLMAWCNQVINLDLNQGLQHQLSYSLCQNWLKWWLVDWGHQAITWTNVDFSSRVFCSICLWVILQEMRFFYYYCCISMGPLTHWGQDKIATISRWHLEMDFLELYLQISIEISLKMFLGAQLTLFQHWFR